MPQIISTNVMSLNAQRSLNRTQNDLQISMARLSSGLRINSARDDAAGLAISERMTAQIRGMNVAIRNASDGISLTQTAEGAMQEVTGNLQRIRELAVQSSNATNSQDDRDALQEEVTQLLEEIDRVADQTTFNGVKLLDGSFTSQVFQVGPDSGNTIDVDIASDFTSGGDLGVSGVSIDTSGGASGAIDTIDTALDTVNSARAELGAYQNRFDSVIANLSTSVENLSAARSRIQDADFAAETAALTRAQILQQAGVAMLSQANVAPQNVLALLQ